MARRVWSIFLSVFRSYTDGGCRGFWVEFKMVRLFNKYKNTPETQTRLLGSVLIFKVLLFGLLALIALPLGRVLALRLGGELKHSQLFAVALITGGLTLFWIYLEAYLQAHRLFAQLAGYIIAYAVLRMGCLAVTYALFEKHALTWFVATYTGPISLLIISGVLPKARGLLADALSNCWQSLSILKEGLDYSKWVALSGNAYTVMPYAIRFFLATHASLEEVGIFSAGMTFTMAFTTLNTAIRAVLFSRVTGIDGLEQMKEYLKKVFRVAPYYAIVATLGIAGLGCVQWFVLGEEYRRAMPVFLTTAAGFGVTLFIGLGTMLVHTMMKPQVEAWVNVGRLYAMLLLAWLIVPSFKAFAAAIAYVVPLVSEKF